MQKDYTIMREDFAGHCNKIDQLEIKLNNSLEDNKYYMNKYAETYRDADIKFTLTRSELSEKMEALSLTVA